MKNRIFLSLIAAVTVCSVAQADIQSPPGHHFNWSRKLSRGIGNLLYGVATKMPETTFIHTKYLIN